MNDSKESLEEKKERYTEDVYLCPDCGKPIGKEPTDDQLLKHYEPVLRFSAGENFFPMDVEDYLSSCLLVTGESVTKVSGSSPELAFTDNESYLNFVYHEWLWKKLEPWVKDRPGVWKACSRIWGAILRWRERFFYLALVIVMIVPWLGIRDSSIVSTNGAVVKLSFILLFLLIWPLSRTNKEAYLAFTLNLFGLLFFGSEIGVAVGLIGLGVMAGVIVWYEFLKLWIEGKEIRRLRDAIRKEPWRLRKLQWKIPLRILVVIGALVGAFFALHNLGGVALLILLATLFWFLVRWGIGKAKDNPERKKLEKAEQKIPTFFDDEHIVLMASFLVLCILYLVGKGLDLDHDVLRTIMSIVSGMVLLWFFLDPQPVEPNRDIELVIGMLESVRKEIELDSVKKKAEKEYEKKECDKLLKRFENLPRKRILWSGRIIMLITLSFGLWVTASIWFQTLNSIFKLNLFYAVVVCSIVVTAIVLDARTMSALMNLISGRRDSVAMDAVGKYKKIRDEKEKYCYYGQVLNNKENGWIVLQYHYFYAFNDSRLTAEGLNHHEGDWEAVAVFLENNKPFGVAYSQHHHGVFRFWDDVKRVKVEYENYESERPTCHPLVYVALGSHANYPDPGVKPTTQQFSGSAYKLVARVDQLIRGLGQPPFESFLLEVRRIKAELGVGWGGLPDIDRSTAEKVLEKMSKIEEEEKMEPGLPLEYACGDGMRLGWNRPDVILEEEFCTAVHLPRRIRQRERSPDGKGEWDLPTPTKDQEKYYKNLWEYKMIEEKEDPATLEDQERYYKNLWEYKGLWGYKTLMKDESGPPGPKWERRNEEGQQKVRPRWGIETWKDVLLLDMVNDENLPVETRRKALESLVRKPSTNSGC